MSDLRKYFGEVWDRDGCTERLYLTHELTAESIVFDVGGYEGDWSVEMAHRYDPHLYIFEPLSEPREKIKRKFRHNVKARIFPFGLASRDDDLPLAKNGAASSLYEFPLSPEFEMCKFRDAATIAVEALNRPHLGAVEIDLIAINIEGGEYDLLRHMITSTLAYRCKEIMVQFHMLYPDCYETWKAIRKDLNVTHEEVWGYPFVWEKWRRRIL